MRGPDELDVAAAADLGKVGVLGEKTIAGVNRLHIADFGGADHAVDFEIAIGALGGTQAIGFVRQIEIPFAAVGFAEDGHGFDAELAAGTNNTECDFAAIRDEDSFKHLAYGKSDGGQGSWRPRAIKAAY